MTRRWFAANLIAVLLLAGVVRAEDETGPKELAAIADAVAPSLVKVEYTIQYDKGQAPGGEDRWQAWLAWQRGSNASAFSEQDSEQWDRLIREERPAEHGGFLVAPSKVITSDPMLHPRFIKSIAVRFGNQVVEATPASFGAHEDVLVLELKSPFKDAKPIPADRTKAGPYYSITYGVSDGAWRTNVNAVGSTISVGSDGRRYTSAGHNALIVDKKGTAVGVCAEGRLPLDESWKMTPAEIKTVSATDMNTMLATLGKTCDQVLPRVTIRFRSPRSGSASRYRRYMDESGDSEGSTEWNGTGIVLDNQTVLVLANLKPKVTARLEKIFVYSASGEELPATFAGTLADYGCLIAKLSKPMATKAVMSSAPITDFRNQLLAKAEITVQGENRTVYYGHDRINFYYTGWHRNIYPALSANGEASSSHYSGSGVESLKFLFAQDGSLIALPIEPRQKVTVQQYGDMALMTPVQQISEVMTSLDQHLDPDNRPLTEDEENRLAWLGVELQPMDSELARANNLSDETNGGSSGGIITYVYPNSPASDAGLEMGDIILRLHVEGQPKPMEVTIAGGQFGMEGFPWQMLDQVPEEYLDEMPKPWGGVENSLTRGLTDVGFGKKFTAEIFHGGKVINKDFKVVQGPPYFDSARHYKSEDLGVTVRDLTYEVRRYFQIKENDPGVILSKIEKGSKAAVAGLKPFEIVLNVNDAPIMNTKDFEKAVSAPGELKLSIKRMTEGRIVKVKSEGAKADSEKHESKADADKPSHD